MFFVTDYALGHTSSYCLVGIIFSPLMYFQRFFSYREAVNLDFTVCINSSVHQNIDFLKSPLVTAVLAQFLYLTASSAQIRQLGFGNMRLFKTDCIFIVSNCHNIYEKRGKEGFDRRRLRRCIATINRWTDYCNNHEIIISNYWLSQKHRKIIGPDGSEK